MELHSIWIISVLLAAWSANAEALSVWSDEVEAEDDVIHKRHLGSALNTRFGTWHYSGGENEVEGEDKEVRKPHSQLQSILDEFEDGGAIKEKRRLGSALNSRYGTWYYRRPNVIDDFRRSGEEDELNENKRFLGPALDVKYRHFGSPFYRPPGTWDSMKRPFPMMHRPLWSGRMRRAAEAKAVDEDATEDIDEDNIANLHHKGTSNRRRKEKRHLGAALGQGYGSFHVTKFRPSKYLRPNESMEDRKAEARMVKFMG